MSNLQKYNYERKQTKQRKSKALKHYGQTAVHVMLNEKEIERRYFATPMEADSFVNEVNNNQYIDKAYAFTN